MGLDALLAEKTRQDSFKRWQLMTYWRDLFPYLAYGEDEEKAQRLMGASGFISHVELYHYLGIKLVPEKAIDSVMWVKNLLETVDLESCRQQGFVLMLRPPLSLVEIQRRVPDNFFEKHDTLAAWPRTEKAPEWATERMTYGWMLIGTQTCSNQGHEAPFLPDALRLPTPCELGFASIMLWCVGKQIPYADRWFECETPQTHHVALRCTGFVPNPEPLFKGVMFQTGVTSFNDDHVACKTLCE